MQLAQEQDRGAAEGVRARDAGHLRVLVHKLGAVVDLVVDDHVEVLLGVVLGNVLVGELLGGHLVGVCVGVRRRSGRFVFFLASCLLAR